MADNDKVKKLAFLSKLSPPARAGLVVGGAAVVVMVVAAVLSPPGAVIGQAPLNANQTTLAIPQTKDTSNEKIAADQLAAKKKLVEQGASIESLRLENIALREKADRQPVGDTSLQSKLDRLSEELNAIKAKQDLMVLPPPPMPGAALPAPEIAEPVAVIEEVNKIRIIGGVEKAKRSEKPAPPPQPKAYIPAGTFFEAVLLNGMDAPTNPVAVKNPVPALARIKTDATLPNLFRHDVKECFVLLAGYGALASERAVMRLESLSCTGDDGKIYESKIDGYVVGEDGRVGMRGRLVSKQGQLIAQSLLSGIVSGFGSALTPTATQGLNLNSGTSYAVPNAGALAGTAVGKGMSDAATSVSKFYLEMASQMTPIIEIDAGRKVTLILTKGVEVK